MGCARTGTFRQIRGHPPGVRGAWNDRDGPRVGLEALEKEGNRVDDRLQDDPCASGESLPAVQSLGVLRRLHSGESYDARLSREHSTRAGSR